MPDSPQKKSGLRHLRFSRRQGARSGDGRRRRARTDGDRGRDRSHCAVPGQRGVMVPAAETPARGGVRAKGGAGGEHAAFPAIVVPAPRLRDPHRATLHMARMPVFLPFRRIPLFPSSARCTNDARPFSGAESAQAGGTEGNDRPRRLPARSKASRARRTSVAMPPRTCGAAGCFRKDLRMAANSGRMNDRIISVSDSHRRKPAPKSVRPKRCPVACLSDWTGLCRHHTPP